MHLSFNSCERKHPTVMQFLEQELPRAGTPWGGIRLDLSSLRHRLTPQDLSEMMRKLQYSYVTELDLSYNHLDDADAGIIAAAAKTNRQLSRIRLSHNSIGDSGAMALAQAQREKPALEIDLTHNQIGPTGAQHWAEACVSANKKTIDLTHNNLGDQGASL